MKKSERRGRIHAALERALSGVTLTSGEYARIRTWINDELPQLLATGYTTYLVFGSYRRGYHRSLRIVQYELNKPASSTAIVLGDTPSIDLTIGSRGADPLEFEIAFHLLTEFADQNVAVYEKDSGGEAVELGLLRQKHCFPRTVVVPRDYYGVGQRRFESKATVLEVARHIAFADDVGADQKRTELRGLIATAQEAGIDITEHEVTVVLEEELADREHDAPRYSWVHLAIFRQFEEAGRCYPWFSEDELREIVQRISRESKTVG